MDSLSIPFNDQLGNYRILQRQWAHLDGHMARLKKLYDDITAEWLGDYDRDPGEEYGAANAKFTKETPCPVENARKPGV